MVPTRGSRPRRLVLFTSRSAAKLCELVWALRSWEADVGCQVPWRGGVGEYSGDQNVTRPGPPRQPRAQPNVTAGKVTGNPHAQARDHRTEEGRPEAARGQDGAGHIAKKSRDGKRMEVTQTFFATSAAAGRRLPARAGLAGLSHLPPPGGCLQPPKPSAAPRRSKCPAPVIVWPPPIAGRSADLVARSPRQHRPGGL